MTRNVEAAVRSVIAKQKCLDPSIIKLDTSLDDLGISSLDAITVVYDIEEEFDVEVPSEELKSLRTVGDIVKGVTALVAIKE